VAVLLVKAKRTSKAGVWLITFVIVATIGLLIFQKWASYDLSKTETVLEVERAARLQAEKLLATLLSQLDVKDDQNNVKDDQIKALTDALIALPQQRGLPNARQRIQEAELEIASGKTEKAQAIYREILQKRKAEGETANREAAEAARRLGALAFLHDTDEALDAYREAVLLEPENHVGWNQLGHLLHRTGDIDEAIRAYTQVGNIGRINDDQELIAISYGNLGNLYDTRGDLDQAETMYRKSLAIEEALGRQEGMASNYGNLGLLYQTRDDLDQAEAMHR
jgi:protein O-GlcNAc transferase